MKKIVYKSGVRFFQRLGNNFCRNVSIFNEIEPSWRVVGNYSMLDSKFFIFMKSYMWSKFTLYVNVRNLAKYFKIGSKY